MSKEDHERILFENDTKAYQRVNKFSYKVQLAHESVTNNTLPFLDCLIEIGKTIREDCKPKYIERIQKQENHALYIKSNMTCKSRYYKNTGKKSKNCL